MPPTDIIKPGHITDLLVYLRTIAASTERIADALEAANANEVAYGTLLNQVMSGPGSQATEAEAIDGHEITRHSDPLAGIPESERYRFR